MTKLTFVELIPLLFILTLKRIRDINNILLPQFLNYFYRPKDRRLGRNIKRAKSAIQNLINERRSGHTKSYDSSDDLLSILITSDFYKNSDDNLIIDEIFTFFFAGMKTI
jgi:cytochrome P450